MSTKTGRSGVGLLSLLGVLFVGLKLTGHVEWSWWWVLAPIWIQPLLIVAFFVVGAAFCLVEEWIEVRRAAR